MVKFLLTEGNVFNEKVESRSIVESDNGKKFWYLEGIFADSKPNRNGRVYGQELWEREVDKYNSERISQRCSYGELNHPSVNAHDVNPDNVAILMTEASVNKDGEVYGKARVLETFKGNIIIGILDGGGRVSVSSRGLGTIGEQIEIGGKKVGKVNKDFSLVCWDSVLFPSNYSCDTIKGVVESVISKAYEFKDGNVVVERALTDFERKLAKNGSRQLAEDLKKFLKSLS